MTPTADEFVVRYAGIIAEMPVDTDPTSRTELLKTIDKAKASGIVTESPKNAELALLRVEPYALHLNSLVVAGDSSSGQAILAVPVHMLAAVCLVRDGDVTILGVKIGEVGNNPDIADLAVLYCDTFEMAQQICNTLAACFQRVYSETMMQVAAKKVAEGAAPRPAMSFLDTSVSTAYGPEMPSFFSGSRTELHHVGGSPVLASRGGQIPSATQYSSTTHSDSDGLSQRRADYIQDYMSKLHETLSQEELQQFAQLLKRWRSDSLPLTEFIQKVSELYGEDRKYLLGSMILVDPGMRPFIGDRDMRRFEEFLVQSGVADESSFTLADYSPEMSIGRTTMASTVELDNASEGSGGTGDNTVVGRTEATGSSTLEDNCTASNSSTIPVSGSRHKQSSFGLGSLPPEPLTPHRHMSLTFDPPFVQLPEGQDFAEVQSEPRPRPPKQEVTKTTTSRISDGPRRGQMSVVVGSVSNQSQESVATGPSLARDLNRSKLVFAGSGFREDLRSEDASTALGSLETISLRTVSSTEDGTIVEDSSAPGSAVDKELLQSWRIPEVRRIERELGMLSTNNEMTTVQVLDSPGVEEHRF